MFWQIGLGVDPTGGIVVLLAGALLALAGLASCVAGVVLLVRRRASRGKALLTLFAGAVLLSPAVWFAWEIFGPDIPRDREWDLSASRSVAQLQEARDQQAYYYQGNIRSTIKLPAGRHWSGNAYLIVFDTREGQVADIHWQSRAADALRAYELAGRILRGLALPERDLEAWHAKVRRGEQAGCSTVTGAAADPGIEVQVRGSVAEESWVVHVNVRWK